MVRQKLNPKILLKLKKVYPKKTENALYVKLSKLSKKYNITINASAEIWGKKENFSVWGLLDESDKESLRDKSFQIIKIKRGNNKKGSKKIIEFINYKTDNKFIKLHLDEINRCYTYNCYTASFILIRKIIENLIMEIIKKKFSGNIKPEKELYLNLDGGKVHDLSILIKNLRKKTFNFDPLEKKLVLRILQLSEQFKDDANDKTHSLYHISSKLELDNKKPQGIFDLINEYFTEYS